MAMETRTQVSEVVVVVVVLLVHPPQQLLVLPEGSLASLVLLVSRKFLGSSIGAVPEAVDVVELVEDLVGVLVVDVLGFGKTVCPSSSEIGFLSELREVDMLNAGADVIGPCVFNGLPAWVIDTGS